MTICALFTIFMIAGTTTAKAQINLFEIIAAPTELYFPNDQADVYDVTVSLNPLTIVGELVEWSASMEDKASYFNIIIYDAPNPGDKYVTLFYQPGDTPLEPFNTNLIVKATIKLLGITISTIEKKVPVHIVRQ